MPPTLAACQGVKGYSHRYASVHVDILSAVSSDTPIVWITLQLSHGDQIKTELSDVRLVLLLMEASHLVYVCCEFLSVLSLGYFCLLLKLRSKGQVFHHIISHELNGRSYIFHAFWPPVSKRAISWCSNNCTYFRHFLTGCRCVQWYSWSKGVYKQQIFGAVMHQLAIVAR